MDLGRAPDSRAQPLDKQLQTRCNEGELVWLRHAESACICINNWDRWERQIVGQQAAASLDFFPTIHKAVMAPGRSVSPCETRFSFVSP